MLKVVFCCGVQPSNAGHIAQAVILWFAMRYAVRFRKRFGILNNRGDVRKMLTHQILSCRCYGHLHLCSVAEAML